MNVLFLSYHYDALFTGPAYSIPGQIEAQSGIDNVFWYNLISESTVWRSLPYYHDLSDYPNGSVHDLPEPFSHPDIIVVEVGLSLSTTRSRRSIVRYRQKCWWLTAFLHAMRRRFSI